MRYVILFSLFAFAANAETYDRAAQVRQAQEMMASPEVQRQMRESMQQMQAAGVNMKGVDKKIEIALGLNRCLDEKVGQEGLDRMTKQGQEVHDKVRALCAAGKRDEAMTATQDYAKAAAASKEGRAAQACADQYKDALNDPSMADVRKRLDSMKTDAKTAHPCDVK